MRDEKVGDAMSHQLEGFPLSRGHRGRGSSTRGAAGARPFACEEFRRSGGLHTLISKQLGFLQKIQRRATKKLSINKTQQNQDLVMLEPFFLDIPKKRRGLGKLFVGLGIQLMPCYDWLNGGIWKARSPLVRWRTPDQHAFRTPGVQGPW